ncbi:MULTISPECIES: phospholipase D family protein [Burkholderia cepacia complex]|uniref:phospholipase D family nuclease n=1 Tax=Burkholderia cepacia complex TaxID=87882 RepID=UPI00158F5BCE|nr:MULTISPECIES: phospholipase D family protein [Burkholderia cepacia complex]MBJ9920551.1 phospholipase D family protein [Burkholderia cenocepacia]
MSNHRALRAVTLAGLLVVANSAHAFDLTAPWSSMTSRPAAAGRTCSSEVGFSPEGSAARLVADVLDRAHSRVRLAAYTFTSPDVVRRLIAAKRRGVDVAVIADAKENTGGRGARSGQAALNLLVEAGIPVRTVSAYAIHHDKYIVADSETVETGSYNYSTAAARRNSENAVVIANCPSLAGAYEAHWQSRWSQGEPYRSSY